MPKVERVLHGHAAILRRKVEHGRRAAEHRRARPRLEIIRSHGHTEIQIKVRVRIDEPRHNIAFGSIDHRVGSLLNVRRNFCDLSILDEQIRKKTLSFGYDLAVIDTRFQKIFPRF